METKNITPLHSRENGNPTKTSTIEVGSPVKLRMTKYKGFTLVELIVVITILVILGTIAFIQLGGFAGSARDSARISNLTNLKKGLDLFQIKSGTYPMPENPVNITASGTIIGHQGFAKDQVGSIAKLSPGGTIDPLDPTMYTTYSVNGDRTKMQAMVFLEDSSTVSAFVPDIVSTAFASIGSDYSKRYPSTLGDTLGILLASGSLQPVQESGTGVDIVLTNTGYMAVFGKGNNISGSGNKLSALSVTFVNNIQFNGYKFTSCQSSDGDVFIGTQCWKNLNQSGGIVNPGASVQTLGTTSCWNDSNANCMSGGGLYQVNTLLNGENFSENIPSGVQGICSSGYHIPSISEYKILFSYIGYYTDNFTNPTPDITGCYSRNLLMGIGVKLADSNGFKLVSTTGQWYSSSGFGNQTQTMLLTSSDSKKGWNSLTILNTSSYPACGAFFDKTPKDSQSKFSVRCIKN